MAARKGKATQAPAERTSDRVAHVAGQLLNGAATEAAVEWLRCVADGPHTTEAARAHAITLLGAMASMKRVAASALTQR